MLIFVAHSRILLWVQKQFKSLNDLSQSYNYHYLLYSVQECQFQSTFNVRITMLCQLRQCSPCLVSNEILDVASCSSSPKQLITKESQIEEQDLISSCQCLSSQVGANLVNCRMIANSKTIKLILYGIFHGKQLVPSQSIQRYILIPPYLIIQEAQTVSVMTQPLFRLNLNLLLDCTILSQKLVLDDQSLIGAPSVSNQTVILCICM